MCRCWGLMLEQLAQGTPYQRQVVNDPCEESEHLCYNPDSGNIYSCDPPNRGDCDQPIWSLHENPIEFCVTFLSTQAPVWGI